MNEKKKRIIKKLTLFSSLIPLLFVLNSSSFKKKDKSFYRNGLKISKGKIEYSKGVIYIGSHDYLDSIENINSSDLLAYDGREDNDPNIRLYDSFKIRNYDTREEIIEGLLYYEELYPTDWNRTKNSLSREWTAHNFAHIFGFKHHRTTDVDLNNADEMVYRIRKY
jgi:hypothetical protein